MSIELKSEYRQPCSDYAQTHKKGACMHIVQGKRHTQPYLSGVELKPATICDAFELQISGIDIGNCKLLGFN